MKRFIFLTFGFLAFGFYELSGGSEFNPTEAREALVQARIEKENLDPAQLQIASSAQVTSTGSANEVPARSSLNLVSFASVGAESVPALATPEPVATPAVLAKETPSIAQEPGLDAPKVKLIGVASLETDHVDVAYSGLTQVAASQNVETPSDVRFVTGSLVNMRAGPGTSFDVVNQLSRNAKVEVLTDGGNGWVELRPVNGGPSGWMAEFLLAK